MQKGFNRPVLDFIKFKLDIIPTLGIIFTRDVFSISRIAGPTILNLVKKKRDLTKKCPLFQLLLKSNTRYPIIFKNCCFSNFFRLFS